MQIDVNRVTRASADGARDHRTSKALARFLEDVCAGVELERHDGCRDRLLLAVHEELRIGGYDRDVDVRDDSIELCAVHVCLLREALW